MRKSHEQLVAEINELFFGQDLDTISGVLFQALIHSYILYRDRGMPLELRDPLRRFLAVMESNAAPEQPAQPAQPVEPEEEDFPPAPPPPPRLLH